MTPDRPQHYSAPRAVAIGGTALAVCLLPMFLTGALGVELTRDLRFGAFGLGSVVAVHRLASIPASVPMGRLADRLGATRSIRISSTMAAAVCFGIALTARNWGVLAAWLAVSGAAMVLAEGAANRLLVNAVADDKLGTAFGFKQSAPPLSTMLAGLSVPLVAVLAGWRSAFVLAGVACVAVLVAVGRGTPSRPRPSQDTAVGRRRLGNPVTILILSASFGFGTAGSATIPAFFVLAAEAAGTSALLAGGVLAVASVVTITTRVVAGFVADRMDGGHLRLCAAGQLVGAAGMAMLATGRTSLMVAGAVFALAGTWGFHGVYWYAMVRAFPEAPGAITGAIQPGAQVGGITGPLAFGAIATAVGYSFAWAVSSSLAVVACGAIIAGSRRLAAERPGAASADGAPG